MSGVLRTVGKVAGVVATVAAFIPGGQPIAAAAAAVAFAANIGAQLTAAKPPHLGSVSDIQIGADQPRPYMMGSTYNGGALVHQIGFGAAINKVPNPYLAMAVVYSAGGPIAGIDVRYADFAPLSFNASGEATGYFAEILFHKAQLGQTPEAAALSGPWSGIPSWGASAKLSGLAAELWSLKWDSKNNKYAAGAPQLGIEGRGVLTWDPRKDSTWPGGSGPHRWVDPRADATGFATAKGTWAYSNRPGLHALRYALGTWERPAGGSWLLTFGVGMPVNSLVVEDFVELENVCDANGWEISGVIYEPGDKWANLKRILAAGGAEPCFKGGRLGLKISAPRVSLDTIQLSDLADGDSTAAGAQPRRDRINTVLPKFRSPAHKWELQQSAPIVITNYLDADGEEKRREVVFELVKDVDQAAQLATYELFNSREQGPIELACGPRMRRYAGGDKLTLSEPLRQDLGLAQAEVVVLARALDPASMNVTLTLVTEYAAKHAAALQVTGVIPAAITLPTTEQLDDGAGGASGQDAPYLLVQWSADGVSAWHADYTAGVDFYQRQSSDGGLTYGPAIKVVAEDGDSGVDGVSSIAVFKRGLTTPTTPANNTGITPTGWSDGPPAGTDPIFQSNAQFRGATQLTNWTTPQQISGANGTNGLNGSNGAPGAPGANGQTSYLHTAYADSADGSANFTTGLPGSRKYLGVLVDFASSDSTLFSDYTWSLIKGADGLNGADGTPGAPGTNGQPTYVHIAYSNAPDGSVGFDTSNPVGRTYVGFYVDQTVSDSTNPASYSWSLVKGVDGTNGANGVNGQDGIVLSASVVAISFLSTYAGVLKPGQIDQTVKFTLADNLVDRSTTTAWSVQTSNCSATINSEGLASFTAVTDSGWVQASAVYNGKTYTQRVPMQKLRDPAPPQTSYSQSAPVSGSGITNTSYPSSPYPIVTIQPDAAGNLSALASLSYSIDNYGGGTKTWNVEVKAAYQLTGAVTWSDFSSGPQTGGASVFTPQDRDGGGVNATMTTTGLDPTKVYNVGLFLRVVGATTGTTAQIGGTFTARSA